MIEFIDHIDKQLFIFLNGFHADWLDGIMLWITGKKEWIPLYLLIIAFIAYTKKWKSFWVFIGIAILITLADQFTSGFMKPFFERLRPCHNPVLEGLVYNIGKCGGQFGFASSHAANTFAIATFLWILFRKRFQYFWLFFIWAAIVSYSRIYVGVHYPGDILVGAGIGVFFAHGVSWILDYLVGGIIESGEQEG